MRMADFVAALRDGCRRYGADTRMVDLTSDRFAIDDPYLATRPPQLDTRDKTVVMRMDAEGFIVSAEPKGKVHGEIDVRQAHLRQLYAKQRRENAK